MDYAKAFDKVDHDLLIKKLQRYGFSEALITWISSFLSNRKQYVVVNGISSLVAIVISGVPQGSVLGPLLFILFINDMSECIKHSIIRFFADDTRLLKHIFSTDDVLKLQEDLYSVAEWARYNNMALNEDKYELLTHLHNQNAIIHEFPFAIMDFTYTLSNGKILYPHDQLKDLGIEVTHDLSWSAHICDIASKGRSMAGWVLSAFKTRDKTAMLTLYKALVRSLMEYCCILWNPTSVTQIQQIESVQRTFTSKINGIQHMNYWERLNYLGIMSLQRRRDRYVIIHMWKILHGKCPNDNRIEFKPLSRFGRPEVLPSLIKGSSKRSQTLYDSSFSVVGPQLWNILPRNLHLITNLDEFKSKLYQFLSLFPDTPPVTGYTPSNNNSLLDWSKNRSAATKLQGQSPKITQ